MNDDLAQLQAGIQLALAGLEGADELGFFRLAILGRRGLLEALMRSMRRMTPEDRATRGAAINQFKTAVDAMFAPLIDTLDFELS